MSGPAEFEPDPLVSVLVVTYTQHARFARCLETVREHTTDVSHEVVVVVNGERRPEHEAAAAAGATVVFAPRNLGLAGGLHAARSRARGRYLMLVQDDVEVRAGWLRPLLAVAEADESVGAVCGRVELFDGKLQQEGRIVWRGAYLTALGDPRVPGVRRAVDTGGTSALLVRAEAWDAIDGPDLGLYPLMYVDIDLALSLAESGWNVMVEPRSVVAHGLGQSTPTELRKYLLARRRRRVARRHAATLRRHEVRDGTPDSLARAVERCARAADERRNRRAFASRRAPAPRRSMDQLVRRARWEAVRLRIGYAVWPVRVFLWRCRERVTTARARR